MTDELQNAIEQLFDDFPAYRIFEEIQQLAEAKREAAVPNPKRIEFWNRVGVVCSQLSKRAYRDLC